MKLPKAVIFDWDETLANTRCGVVLAIEEVLKKYGKEEWLVVKKNRDHNLSFKDNFFNFFGEKHKEAHDDYLNIYLEKGVKNTSLKEGALRFVEFLTENNILLYIISNKDKTLLEKEVNKCFEGVFFIDVIGDAKKPSPESVFTALKGEFFNINKDNVWFVGDTKQDLDCAKNAGVLPVILGGGDFAKSCEKDGVLTFGGFVDFYKKIKIYK